MIEYLSAFFIILGLFFLFTTIVGFNRLPDFFCKMHAATVGDVVGCPCILVGISLRCENLHSSLKILFLAFLLIVLNPVASYLLNKIAIKDIKK